ncbi:hypothetical protein JAAARDRAFT_63263 [Jaapia argillacea MUCL 33604]|uniref:Uncharacterized protein n=1 Tax=Jaapia argillacea MUCL 33604 TaxID=933084 RepID=A0A067PIL3_9AGAM|nr:hypothetical protein JAAARDRAFT_63263 [Jaapia argillacea MUCL 33604]
MRRHPEDTILSYDQVQQFIVEFTAIVPIKHDMCINSCVAFTRLYQAIDFCLKCSSPCLDPIKLTSTGGKIEVYDDIYTRKLLLNAVLSGKVTSDNTILLFLIDGTQLYWSKASDCWIYIWKKHVLPGSFIPGLNKPKNLEFFLFQGLHHLAAIQ